MRRSTVVTLLVASLLSCAALGWAQPPPGAQSSSPLESAESAESDSLSPVHDPIRGPYVLGPGDEISIQVLDSEEFSASSMQVGTLGQVDIPLIGRIDAAGLSVLQLEQLLAAKLSAYIHNPLVSVRIARFRSQPVTVIGAVQKPGVHQLEGRKTLVEVLSTAGGLREDADNTVKITRRLEMGRVPLENAREDSTGRFSIAEVNVKEIMEAQKPHENILIRPHDVISVPRAKMIYVVGAVGRSGGFVLIERESVSVLEALALAQGLTRTASPDKARILRPSEGAAARTEIAVDVKQIMAGKSADVPLKREDILFIPDNKGKAAALRAAELALGIGSTAAIWRVAR